MRIPSAPSLRRVRSHLSGAGRVWILTASLGLVAAALFFLAARSLPALEGPVSIPWWLIAVLFYLTETYVVHFEFRRDAHSFSLSEVPLILGLFFTSPAGLIAAALIGSALALALPRKQSPLKMAFNLAHFTLEAVLATIIFHSIAGPSAAPALQGWIGTAAAMLVSTTLAVLSIFAAISLSEGRLQLAKFSQVLASGLVVTATNASLALVGVSLVWANPHAGWLLLVPCTTVMLAYKAYTSERHKHASLDFLYQATRTLNESRRIEEGVALVLEHARQMFRAELAEVIVFPSDEADLALRTTIGPGEAREVMIPLSDEARAEVHDALMPDAKAVFLSQLPSGSTLKQYFEERGIADAMVAALRGETRVMGIMIIAERLGDVSTFDGEDLKLFETLAYHTSVAFENGRLEESLAHVLSLKEQLRHQASHDPLTGLANRVLFGDRIEHALTRRDRDGPLAVLFLDLDDFKNINDSLGHTAGDQLLVAVGKRLESCLRAEDTAARLGGDEFGILIDETRDPTDAIYVAERIMTALEGGFTLAGKEVFIHTSLGIAFSDEDVADADDLLRNADVAMYRAKHSAKGTFEVFRAEMHAAVLDRMELKGELQDALDRDEFVLHYQPVVDLKSGQSTGFEALIRWEHPVRGLIGPLDFIPLAEETGLIVPIGRWILGSACAQVRRWHIIRPDQPLTMAVNLSALQLQQPDFVRDVADALRTNHLPAECLVLELTEGLLMDDSPGTLVRLTELRSLGVQLSLDDFGTGLSSLGHLKSFPLDSIKIGRCFVDELDGEAADPEFVDAMIKLGSALKLKVIAEGIERPEQLTRLQDLNCERGQGFHFARPMTAAMAEQFMKLASASPDEIDLTALTG